MRQRTPGAAYERVRSLTKLLVALLLLDRHQLENAREACWLGEQREDVALGR